MNFIFSFIILWNYTYYQFKSVELQLSSNNTKQPKDYTVREVSGIEENYYQLKKVISREKKNRFIGTDIWPKNNSSGDF